MNVSTVGAVNRYNPFPSRASPSDAQQEQIRAKFASGDTGGTIWLLTPEEAASQREEARNAPTALNVSADEITDDRFSATRDNVTYYADGVSFGNREMSGLKEIAKSAISMLPAMGSALDYNAYASMGLAVNMVRAYASEHLTEEQGAVAVKSIENYVGRLADAQRAGQSGQVSGNYYGASGTVTAAADALRSKIAALPGAHAVLLDNLSAAQTKPSLTASATNKELSDSIRAGFSTVDLRDKAAVKSLLDSYRNKVTPAYREWGLGDTGYDASLASKLANDEKLFSNQIAGILSALDKANGIAVNRYA